MSKSILLLLAVFGWMSFLGTDVQAQCGTLANLQVSVNGNLVTFSWSGTGGADAHAILLRNEQTGQNSYGYTSVGSSYTATNISNGQYGWRVIALCNTAAIPDDHFDWVWGGTFTMTGECTTPPSIAQAGADQLNLSGTSTTLSATVPSEGTGAWTIVSGTGGSFGSASNAASTFTGTAGTTYVLRWTVSNACGSSSDDVTVHFEEETIPVNPYLNPDLNYGSVADIDGNTYATIQIGTQTWMAENLRTTRYNDGTTIQNITDNATWQALTTGAWAYYNNDASNNSTYGKLYNWYAVNTGKLCPTGWHIPTDAEWTVLTDYLGGLSVAGGKMKSTTGWEAPNTGATNESGFSGLPSGNRFYNGIFEFIGSYGSWWSSTERITSYAWVRGLNYTNTNVTSPSYNKGNGYSCRCLMD